MLEDDSLRKDPAVERSRGDDVSVVILARNEERSIGDVIAEVKPYCAEVLVMDGHSRDRTIEVSRQAGARVEIDPGFGKGSAVRASFTLASHEIVVLMDADGSHSAGDIPRLCGPIISDTADMVVGSRFTGGSDELSVNFPQLIRTIGNISMNIAINSRFGVSLTDTLNGFKAVRRDVAFALELRENRHTIEQEMVIQAIRRGYRVINVSTHEYCRRFGTSTIDVWKEWPRFCWCLARNLVQPRIRDARGRG